MKRVLVTGATGFIGRHSLEPLRARGFEVHAVYCERPKPEGADVRWHSANLFEHNQVCELFSEVKPTHLLHFAWGATPGEFWTSPENMQWVRSGIDLVESFAANGGERFVAAGTCAEYDREYGYCSESVTPLKPATIYGTSKRAFWMLVDAFAAQAGLSAAWGRIFFLYGPHEHPDRLVPAVVSSLLSGREALCSHGAQIRDWLHVQDVADAFVALLDSRLAGPINIASGRPVAIKDVVYKIAEIIGVGPGMVNLGAVSTPANDPRLLVADTRRLNNEAGWLPQYDLESGLAQTIDWWKTKLAAGRHGT